MALCTQGDIESRLQITFTDPADPVIIDLIEAAQAHIEGYVGREVESAQYEEVYDPFRAAFQLKHWPVTEVAQVKVEAEVVPADEIVFYPSGRIFRFRSRTVIRWGSTIPRSVQVTYTGGYLVGLHDRELAHLGSLCAEIVARAFRLAAEDVATPVGAGPLQSVSLAGSDSVAYATGDAVRRVPREAIGRWMTLTDQDRFELGPYLGVALG